MIYEINNSTELYHWGFKKGEKRPGSKYIARVGTFPKYRYFYTQSEYNAYLTNGDKNQNKSASNQNSLLGKKLSSIFTISKKEDKKVENVNSNKTIPNNTTPVVPKSIIVKETSNKENTLNNRNTFHSRPVNVGEGKVKAEKGEKVDSKGPVGYIQKIGKKKGIFIVHSMLPQVVSMTAELITNQVNSTSKPEPEYIPFPGANVVSDNSNIDWEYIYDNTAYPNGVNAGPIGVSTNPLDTLITMVGDVPKVVSIPPQEETIINSVSAKIQQKKICDAWRDIENDISELDQKIPSLSEKFESTGKVEDFDAMVKCQNDYIQLQFAKETTAAAIMLFIMSYGYNPITEHKIDTTAPYIYYDNFNNNAKFQADIWEKGKHYNIIRADGHINTYVCALDGSSKTFKLILSS